MHEKFMIEAIKEANKSLEINEVPVGAVIVKMEKLYQGDIILKKKTIITCSCRNNCY